MKPLVSIIIPAFNSQEWVGDTLQSAVSQTWDRKEIIVVDDGSSDRTLAVARQFESNSVTVITQKNQGASAARNKALSICRGDYIQYLDHDDLLAPDKIERQIHALSSGGSERTLLSSSWGYFRFRPSRAKFVQTPLWCDLSPTEFLVRKLEQNLFMQTSVWLVSRELTEAAGPWNTTMLTDDDGEYFCRVLLACDRVRFVPDAQSLWRRSGMTQGSYIGGSGRKREALWRSMQLHIGYPRSLEDSERVRAACVRYLQTGLQTFYPERPDLVAEMHNLASELQGQLDEPRLRWKFAWMKALFGWNVAKRAQYLLPQCKESVLRYYDKTMYRFETRTSGANRAMERQLH